MGSTFWSRSGAYRCDIGNGPIRTFIGPIYAVVSFTEPAIRGTVRHDPVARRQQCGTMRSFAAEGNG